MKASAFSLFAPGLHTQWLSGLSISRLSSLLTQRQRKWGARVPSVPRSAMGPDKLCCNLILPLSRGTQIPQLISPSVCCSFWNQCFIWWVLSGVFTYTLSDEFLSEKQCQTVIPVPGRRRQGDWDFRASLSCMAKLSKEQNPTSKCPIYWMCIYEFADLLLSSKFPLEKSLGQ